MLKSVNAAMPATAATTVVPESVPPDGLLAMARVTFPLKPSAIFPSASCATTSICGVIVAAAVTVLGSTANTSVVAVPALIAKGALIADCSPVAVPVNV